MAKKEWREVPESELTEEQVRRWFNRLRELYKEAKNHIHEIKVDRGKLRVEKYDLLHEIKILKRENRVLKEEMERMEKAERQAEKSKVIEKSDFKKRFLDSL